MKYLLILLLLTPSVLAGFGDDISSEDKATFDQILEPVLKIYNLVKYIATAIATLVLLISGIGYMVSGSDPKKRENAKSMGMYVILGLVIVWGAPLVVNFIVS